MKNHNNKYFTKREKTIKKDDWYRHKNEDVHGKKWEDYYKDVYPDDLPYDFNEVPVLNFTGSKGDVVWRNDIGYNDIEREVLTYIPSAYRGLLND